MSAATSRQLWAEWKRVTRFLGSARIAYAREAQVWSSLELARPEEVVLAAPAGKGNYRVLVAEHLAAVQDETTLHAAVLVQTYTLAEWAALNLLGLESRDVGGIEDWGERLLTYNNKAWRNTLGGLAGAVETAVMRNAFAHGSRSIDAGAARRLMAAGSTARAVGAPVTLTFDELLQHRSRLKSLLRAGGL